MPEGFDQSDLWPEGEPDPLAFDEPAAPTAPDVTPSAEPEASPAPAAAPLPAPEPPAAVTEPVPAPASPTGEPGATAPGTEPPQPGAGEPGGTAEAEEDLPWRERFNATRELQRRTANENAALRTQLETIGRSVQSLIAQQEQRAQTMLQLPQTEEFMRRAAEQGFEPEQVRLMQALASEIADQRVAAVQQEMQTSAQQQQAARALDTNRRALDAFRAAHTELTPELGDEMVEVLREVGAIDERGAPLEDIREDILQIALEAATDQNLRFVLRANPMLYETDEGITMARILASLYGTSRAPATTQPSAPSAAPSTEQVDAALRAAHTEPGSSGAPSPAGGPPRDEFDDVLEYAKTAKRSAFTT